MTPTTLPQAVVIDNTAYIQHWRSHGLAIYQNYCRTTPPSDQPITQPGGVIEGTNEFHLFRIEHTPEESLGAKLGTYSTLIAAMNAAEKLE